MANHAFAPCHPRLAVAIADESPAMREGLARLVADECDLAFAGSAASPAELRTLVAQSAPGVLIMDLTFSDGDGFALIKDLLGIAATLRIVVFTAQPAEIYAERCLRAGARAYVMKRDAVSTLFRAVREVAAGGVVVPRTMAAAVIAAGQPRTPAGDTVADLLTNRELQVFRLAGLALSTRVIAGKLGVSIKTVETHRENIKNKLSLDSHAGLVARAAQWVREHGGL